MKSKAQVLRERPEYKTLINAVVNNIGLDSIEDVNAHGIDGGFSGFIYYSDTHAFAMRYRKLIVQMLEEQAADFGEEVTAMVRGFGVFRNSAMDADDLRDLYKYLGGGKPEQGTITNVMAWYAAEEVCRMFED
jgi:hypothetical protein